MGQLAALSTLLSGVIIASIGIWVNHSLTTGQERAKDAQADATREMEKAHNATLDTQAANALRLQAQQTADALAFQRQQAVDGKALEELRMQQQRQQAVDALKQQREHDQAVLQVQQAQLAKDFMPQVAGADSKSRAGALRLLALASPKEAIILSETYSETSADASLRQTSQSVLISLQKSVDPVLRAVAADARVKVANSKRIQAVTNVFESGKPTRDYSAIYFDGEGRLVYGGFFTYGKQLHEVISRYCNVRGGVQADALRSFLDRILREDEALAKNPGFAELLKQAAKDVVMQEVQDEVFDQDYWRPAQVRAASLGLKLPLSVAAVFDTEVNLGTNVVSLIATSASFQVGGEPSQGIDEKTWTTAFVAARRARLEKLKFPVLLRRVDFFARRSTRVTGTLIFL